MNWLRSRILTPLSGPPYSAIRSSSRFDPGFASKPGDDVVEGGTSREDARHPDAEQPRVIAYVHVSSFDDLDVVGSPVAQEIDDQSRNLEVRTGQQGDPENVCVLLESASMRSSAVSSPD